MSITKIIAIFVLSMVGGLSTASACTDMQIMPAEVTVGSVMTLTCKTDVDVKQIALEIIGEQWNASYPYLYDDGSHGDKVKEDKNYSLSINAPAVAGTYKVKFFRIMPDQSEMESNPITFSVNKQ